MASGQPIAAVNVAPLVKLNANYAALMPFGFMRAVDDPYLVFNSERQWFGERKEGVQQYIDELRKQDIEVMLKPQLWISNGAYTGHLEMATEAEWRQFEMHYREFILTFARQATKAKVPIFCIGTELERFIAHRPDFWFELIAEVRQIYPGKLTLPYLLRVLVGISSKFMR